MRLEGAFAAYPGYFLGFQFQIGAIRGALDGLGKRQAVGFQFQIGAIRGCTAAVSVEGVSSFNSKLVRLEEMPRVLWNTLW